ncbi:MAG: hypothetical protein DWI11_00690 [Planctomycetota bacterium]|jgi:hypothetical protein|nr:MAG: hypothetical protein DWI11_00690 [Planctomycetota bacterium]
MSAVTHIPDIEGAARLAARAFAGVSHGLLFGRSHADWRAQSREALGLPLGIPLIITGHQAGIWHAGIAEKFRYASMVARALGGAVLHIVIDHDSNDAAEIAFPAEINGNLTRLLLERSPRERGVNAFRSPVRMRRPDALLEGKAQILPHIDRALSAMEHAIAAHATQPNLALQMAHAANLLLPEIDRAAHTVAATTIARLPFAQALRDHFDARARDCYNLALATQRITRLRDDELPFWKLNADTQGRDRLLVGQDSAFAAPRALTLTALARLTLGDLFVHGTGGAVYERATDHWLNTWIGVETPRAPIAVATATRLVEGLEAHLRPLDATVSSAQLRRLDSDPFGASLSSEKRAFLSKIQAIPRSEKAARMSAFEAMQSALRHARETNASARAELKARLDSNAGAARMHALATDRTWPFPFTLD